MKDTHPALLVEDDELDQKSVKRAWKELKILNPLIIKNNGQEALEHLAEYKGKDPCLVLLDINMPRMNGIEFLRAIRNDPRFKIIPVIMLTTSKEEKDLIETYNLGVSGYIAKPVDYKEFIEVVRTIHLYWSLSMIPDLAT